MGYHEGVHAFTFAYLMPSDKDHRLLKTTVTGAVQAGGDGQTTRYTRVTGWDGRQKGWLRWRQQERKLYCRTDSPAQSLHASLGRLRDRLRKSTKAKSCMGRILRGPSNLLD